MDALIEATARILAKEGFEAASTNRIAEAAGVSIGSLYQYFPCKEALVASVIDRHNERLMEVARGTLAEVVQLPLDRAIRKIVAVAIEAHSIDPKLHRVLTEQTPRTGRLVNAQVFNQEIYGLFRRYLESRKSEIRKLDLDLAAFVCVTSIEALSHTAVLHRSDILANGTHDALVDEATRLIVRYLR